MFGYLHKKNTMQVKEHWFKLTQTEVTYKYYILRFVDI